jgi:hypothetical protein
MACFALAVATRGYRQREAGRYRMVEQHFQEVTSLMASYEQWLEVFQRACHDPDRASELVCPNCGERQLRLLFVIYGTDEDRVNAVFWCGSCLEGLPPGPSEVPAGCARVRHEGVDIPNYRIARPGRRSGAASSQ